MSYQGLTTQEVNKRVALGKVNMMGEDSTQSVKEIIKANVFTYFNGIFALLSLLLIIAGSFKNLTFLAVVVANTLIGIVQQLRSKKILDELSLLDVTKYKVIRDQKEATISSDQLVQDDLLILGSGQQIPADGVVVAGNAAVNESLLTGEPDEVEKKTGDDLKSGSFVVSGECMAKLTRVGEQSYAARLTRKAKEVKERPAEMVRDIERIIKVTGLLIIPVGFALVFQSMVINHNHFQDAVVSMVSAVVGMIPEGMYLLVTVALALSAARLARKQVLLHDMHSIETLARVDVLCVDKTGTITKDEMEVDTLVAPVGIDRVDRDLLCRYVQTIPDTNITMQALRNYCGTGTKLIATQILPFSSKNKYSQIQTTDHTYRLGAPEYLLQESDLSANQNLIHGYAGRGERVLALTCDGTPVLFVVIKNNIRENAPEIFSYFADRGVDIKVISGDNPVTVARIAQLAGIKDAQRYVDATTLKTDRDYAEALKKYTVFGRVKPEQKKRIVTVLRGQKKKVAMTGDGVNDILAMKEADCSIAMGGGSDATRQAAQVVLLDSDFSHMKDIVGEGRRDVNNITRSATLFLYKNIFSFLLAVFSIINSFTYPLQPNQVSLISMFNIGIPAFLLALENNEEKQGSSFIKTTLFRAMPAALTSFFSIAFMVLFGKLFHISEVDIATASTYLLAVIGFMILWKISKPENIYHIFVIIICIVGMILCAAQFHTIFDLNAISLKCTALCGVFAIAEITVMNTFTWIFDQAGNLKINIQEKKALRQKRKDLRHRKNNK